ncbi:hypothetical protein VL20_2554 [Microcystis panniformis FACHB-1757]|uniref:Uncharacterized protein n=1 Tax=Microcystis panniformis FACHB-1757 TaxID=1638788 RepID=A0A0K1S0H7_9CHRO|nr:hypothetical protein VL20_2554 [Microcystis panniformis FACHB-1757]
MAKISVTGAVMEELVTGNKYGSSVCVMQWTGVIGDGTLM